MTRTLVAAYSYVDPIMRAERFQHVRYRLDPPVDGRSKGFGYRWEVTPGSWDHHKPAWADEYLYRLTDVLRAIDRGAPVYWTEGEKDADALAHAGVAATAHHGGATNATKAQARWLIDASRVVLVADRDAPGWDCALRRYELLRGLGVKAERLSFVRARGPRSVNDAADHLEIGFQVAELVPVELAQVVRGAARATPSAYRRAGYRPPGATL